jgi:PAS domain S-box-containing protein
MIDHPVPHTADLAQRLTEAEATIEALLSGQIDAVVDSRSRTPVLLSKAQAALRESEERYRRIVETTTDGILTLDPTNLIVFVNRRFAEMLGYQSRDMIGKGMFTFVSAAGQMVAVDAFKRQQLGSRVAVDSALLHRNGTEVMVNIAASPVLDAEGRQVGSLAVVRDVTEQRKLQSQLMVSDRMASVGTLAAGVAHEINNPLAAVMANLDYIADALGRFTGGEVALMAPATRDTWIRDEIKPSLDDAREAAERVRVIVRDLKMFSRSPSDNVVGAVDVKTIMESSLRMAWTEVRHRARLVKIYGRVPSVDANEARLGQVFLNLIVNAAQAMPEGRANDNEIRVSTRFEAGRVIIEVSDTGVGIPPEIRNRVFDAFFTTKGAGIGTGLGLAICHRIVTDMGGELAVESEAGAGTTFRVSLPVAVAPAIEAVTPPQALQSGRRGRILVVDDEEIVIRIVEKMLSKEHDVVAMVEAKEALALCARGEKFDLILCDLMMPIMTGMEFYRELSRVDPDQAERMIFVTGGAFTEKGRHFLSEKKKECIEKPFNSANLRVIVQRYLR